MMWGVYDGWSWLWMAAVMLLFWGGIATLAVFVVRALIQPRGRRSGDGRVAAAPGLRRDQPGGVREDPQGPAGLAP
jgi:hypothetical protein